MNIALVNDQSLAIEALRRVVTSEPRHQVVWTARNGAEAVQACATKRPDVILMDLIMPVVDGVEATRRIMAATPCPILVVTSSMGANTWRVYEAMGHGALDAVETPILGKPASAIALLEKLALVERRARFDVGTAPTAAASGATAPARGGAPLIAIGASAGGPAAIAAVLGGLPKTLSAPVVIVQHVDAQFADGMAEWLNHASPIKVRTARDGDAVEPGAALLAATNDHLVLRDAQHLAYTAEPLDHVYRPSVDVFFSSVASRWPGRVIGVLLTGMGRDGAVGLKVLRNHGHRTIAQDEATSALYGMPRAAAVLNAACDILPLPRIAARVAQLAGAEP